MNTPTSKPEAKPRTYPKLTKQENGEFNADCPPDFRIQDLMGMRTHEAAHGLNGRLFPLGWARFLWRLKTRKVSQGRVPLMGLKKKFQKGRRGVALTTEICSRAFDAGKEQGFSRCELSWVLEDNQSMIGICDLVGAERYKTYRMVEAVL